MIDAEQFSAWWPKAERDMIRALRADGVSEHLMPDVTQTVAAAVLSPNSSIHFRDERHFAACCVTTARWRVKDEWRHYRRVTTGYVPDHGGGADVADLVGDPVMFGQMIAFLDELSPEQRRQLGPLGTPGRRFALRAQLRARFSGLQAALAGPGWRLVSRVARLGDSRGHVIRRGAAVATAAAAVAIVVGLSGSSLRNDRSIPPAKTITAPAPARPVITEVEQTAGNLVSNATGVVETAPGVPGPRARPRTKILNPLTGEPTGFEVGPEQPGEEGVLLCGLGTLVTEPRCYYWPDEVLFITSRV